MKKNDWLLIGSFIILALVAWLLMNGPVKEAAEGEAVIYKDGAEYRVIPLGSDETIIVEDENGKRNVIRVHQGQAEMIEADCPDQICVHTRPAQNDGESVVCLPNRVVVEVRSRKKEGVDGVSE